MLIDEFFHFTFSIITGLVFGYIYHDFWTIPVALLSGFFIDADHLIDYFLFTKFRRFSLREFASGKFFDYAGKVYVFAHGFEYAIAAIILATIFPQHGWIFYSLGISNLIHLVYDTIFNKPIWPTYFLVYRIIKKFDHETFGFPKCR